MQERLILGIDLCDDYSQMGFLSESGLEVTPCLDPKTGSEALIPTVICKRFGKDEWEVGEDAYHAALTGKGTVVDKLLRLVLKEGTATIEGVKYSAQELLAVFIKKLLDRIEAWEERRSDAVVVFTIQEKRSVLMDAIIRMTDQINLNRENVHIINHAESFLFFVLTQEKEIWANQVSLFDLTSEGLHYYELNMLRGRKPPVVEVSHELLDESFSLELLDTPSGCKLADKILTTCSQRLFARKVFSAVYVTGKGFESTDWAINFFKYICNRRRVFAGQNLFVKGAVYLGNDYTRELTSYPYEFLCEGRLPVGISMNVMHEGRERQLVIAQAGSNWYEAQASITLILDGETSIDFIVSPLNSPIKHRLSIPLDEFPTRPPKTTRVEIVIAFKDETKMAVRIYDRGFGDFFPSSGKVIRQEFDL